MRLRTLAGAHAGQIRDYPYAVGMSALRTGMAERVDEVPQQPLTRRKRAAVGGPSSTQAQRTQKPQ